jgi:hypothetical protein
MRYGWYREPAARLTTLSDAKLFADDIIKSTSSRHKRPRIAAAEAHLLRDVLAPGSGQATCAGIAKQRVRTVGLAGTVDCHRERLSEML